MKMSTVIQFSLAPSIYSSVVDNGGLSLEGVNQRMHVLCIKCIGPNIERISTIVDWKWHSLA